jgi:hypothetical protein
LTDKEVGRLTLTSFHKLYKHYKNNFDIEMLLKTKGMTYEQAFLKSQEDEEWL